LHCGSNRLSKFRQRERERGEREREREREREIERERKRQDVQQIAFSTSAVEGRV
jgi:hypothetical protein